VLLCLADDVNPIERQQTQGGEAREHEAGTRGRKRKK